MDEFRTSVEKDTDDHREVIKTKLRHCFDGKIAPMMKKSSKRA